MGGEQNLVHVITKDGVESWERMEKGLVAMKLARKIADALG
jgi:phosphopantothenoylcysteine decarboxylase / phosphopantothenate---cysteine ligase